MVNAYTVRERKTNVLSRFLMGHMPCYSFAIWRQQVFAHWWHPTCQSVTVAYLLLIHAGIRYNRNAVSTPVKTPAHKHCPKHFQVLLAHLLLPNVASISMQKLCCHIRAIFRIPDIQQCNLNLRPIWIADDGLENIRLSESVWNCISIELMLFSCTIGPMLWKKWEYEFDYHGAQLILTDQKFSACIVLHGSALRKH